MRLKYSKNSEVLSVSFQYGYWNEHGSDYDKCKQRGPEKILYWYPILIDVFLFILIVVVPGD